MINPLDDLLLGDLDLRCKVDVDYDSGQGDGIIHKRPFRLDTDDSDLFSSKVEPQEEQEPGEFKENIPAVHFPLFDFDFPVTVIPSRTAGHFHVILQKEVSTEQYQDILNVFISAGLVQSAWADRLANYGAIFLRLPVFFKKLINRGRIIYGKKKCT